MKLYHFTKLFALIGVDGVAAMRADHYEGGDGGKYATPDSILRSGIHPHPNTDFDSHLRKPLPECVWLTDDPEMPKLFTNRNTLDGGEWRIDLAIPECSRLKHFATYLEKHCCRDFILTSHTQDGHHYTGHQLAEVMGHWYVYFGTIPPDRIRSVTCRLLEEA
jgi:hypothetical protein